MKSQQEKILKNISAKSAFRLKAFNCVSVQNFMKINDGACP